MAQKDRFSYHVASYASVWIRTGAARRAAGHAVPTPANIYAMPLRFKLGGRPILSTHLNVETARSERKRPEI